MVSERVLLKELCIINPFYNWRDGGCRKIYCLLPWHQEQAQQQAPCKHSYSDPRTGFDLPSEDPTKLTFPGIYCLLCLLHLWVSCLDTVLSRYKKDDMWSRHARRNSVPNVKVLWSLKIPPYRYTWFISSSLLHNYLGNSQLRAWHKREE